MQTGNASFQEGTWVSRQRPRAIDAIGGGSRGYGHAGGGTAVALPNGMMRSGRRRRGQVATEYMLVVSVVVLAVVSSAYAFVPTFRTGVERVGADVRQMLATGQIGRAGAPGSGASPAMPLNRGCGSGMVCNPPRSDPFGLDRPSVCRLGDRC